MDTAMTDVGAKDSFSDDDWGAPSQSAEDAGLNSDDDFDLDDLTAPIMPDVNPLVPDQGAAGDASVPVKKKKAVRFSHLAGEDEGEGNDAVEPSAPTVNTPVPQPRSNSPGLFVSSDEEDAVDDPLYVKGSTELNYPSNALHKLSADDMDGLTRARAIKAKIGNNISVLQPPDKVTLARPAPQDDAEDEIIKTLRKEQNMGWGDIANFLNQERRNRGDSAHLTASSVYSRFVRSAPRIPVPVNEMGFDPKDYQHLRHPNQYANGEGTGTISKAGKKRVKNYDNAKELEANMRKLASEDEFADLETVEKTDQLMDAVAKVERNFWTLVADEMERATTKLYPAGRLAKRYHEI